MKDRPELRGTTDILRLHLSTTGDPREATVPVDARYVTVTVGDAGAYRNSRLAVSTIISRR